MTVGDLQHHVVDGRQIQHIGHGGVVAVLGQLLGDVADGDTAAVRCHTLGQRRQRLVERAELAPLHRLAAAHRQALGGRELVVYQLGFGVLQQLHAVVGLHLGAETAGGLCVGLRKHLQLHIQFLFHFPFSFHFPFHPLSASFRLSKTVSSPPPAPVSGCLPAPSRSTPWDRNG